MRFHHYSLAVASLIGSLNPIYAEIIDQDNTTRTCMLALSLSPPFSLHISQYLPNVIDVPESLY